ncbi:MAG: glycosyltransferase, partial [Thermodesulfobacteriota bacterium]
AGVASSCRFLGEISDMPAFYNGLTALCSSSESEGFPNVLAEAMACGVPCAATDAGDSARIAGDTSRIVARNDPAALSHALASLLALSPVERSRVSADCRQRIAGHFSLASAVEAYENLFSSLAGDGIIKI